MARPGGAKKGAALVGECTWKETQLRRGCNERVRETGRVQIARCKVMGLFWRAGWRAGRWAVLRGERDEEKGGGGGGYERP